MTSCARPFHALGARAPDFRPRLAAVGASTRHVAWTGWDDDPDRLEAATVVVRGDRLAALGTSRATTYATSWALRTGPGWVTEHLDVSVHGVGWSRHLDLVRTPDGAWRDVAEQTDQFLDRVALFSFAPVEVTAVRVTLPMTTERDVPVLAANYTGIVGGLHPDFLPLATESEWIATISAVRAWEPAG